MPKSVQGVMPEGKIQAYNQGYGDGYWKQKPRSDSFKPWDGTYMRAYIVGAEDRLEDDEAVELGEFDLLNEEERRYLYGDENDRV